MPTAYILVNCTLGSEERIISEISNLPDVKEVRGTYGVHDVFAKVKSDNTEAMNHRNTSSHRGARRQGKSLVTHLGVALYFDPHS
jgi:hypothetical protein